MAPIRQKTKSQSLVLRFRETVRRHHLQRKSLFHLINTRYSKENPMNIATLDKILYSPALGNVSADTAIILTNIINDHSK